ncbi:MAG TPA: GAF domain-containing protein [Chloroflexota bacterium]|nr:GAF domain-containing protein [Chloroflexota bacterium]
MRSDESRGSTRVQSVAHRSRRDLAAVLDLLPLALVDTSLDLDTHLRRLADRIRATLNADSVVILLEHADGGSLESRAYSFSQARIDMGIGDFLRPDWPLDSGVVGWVIQNRRAALVTDTMADDRVRRRRLGISESVIAAPLLVNGHAIGAIRVSALAAHRFVERDKQLVEALALATGIAVENARLSHEARGHLEQLEERYRAVQTLAEIGTLVLESFDSGAVAERILDRALALGPFDIGIMHLLRDNRLEPVAHRGLRNAEHAESYFRSDETGRRQAMFHVMASREPLVVEDVQTFDGMRVFKPEGVQSAIVVPIRAGAEVLGVMAVGSRSTRDLTPSTVQLLAAMGSQFGLAIQKSRLHLEMQQALSDLQQTEARHARLAAILEATPEMVAIADRNGRRLYLNAAGRRLLGIGEHDDVTGESWTTHRPPAAVEHLLSVAIPAAIRDGIWSGESTFLARDGREIPVSQLILAHKGPDGSVDFYSTIARDLTERRRIEAQLARAQRLETAGRIAGQVAHDFNNLLAPLVGYPELIKMRLPTDHPVVAFCDEMVAAATRIAEINDDLLTLGRRGYFQHRPMDLNRLVLEAVEQTSDRPDTLDLRLDLAADLLPIQGSGAQLTRLLSNLISNARDALRDVGSLTIRTQSVYLDQPIGRATQINVGEYVQLEVSDTGVGIPPESRDRIFDVFFTTKTTDKRRGSGLGLSVVQAVADDHHAYVDFESAVGKGTTFRVYFPVYRGSDALEAPNALTGGNESVLVVDDDAGQREVMHEMLRTLGYRVAVAECGQEAVRCAQEQCFDLVILDMVMPPGIDGAETYRQLCEIRPGQRAIIVSGYAESGRVGQAQALGAGKYVRKPVTVETLARAVREELDRERT